MYCIQCTPLHCNNFEFTIHLMIVGLPSTALFQYLKCQDQRVSKNCRSSFIFCSSWNLWGGPFFTFSLPGGRRAPLPPVSYATGFNGWARVKRERTKSRERFLLMIVLDSSHLQHECERPNMERNYLNSNKTQRIDSKLTTINSEMCGATNVQSNQACILQHYKS